VRSAHHLSAGNNISQYIDRFQIIAPDPTDSSSTTRVLYNSRRSVDTLIESIRQTGNYGSSTFGQKRDLCQSIFKKMSSQFTPSGEPGELSNIGVTVSVNPPGWGGGGTSASGIRTLWANTDAAEHRQLDPETLEPIGYADQTKLHPELKGIFSAAHAQKDPATGDVFNYNLEIGRTSAYKVFVVSSGTGKTDILAVITDAAPAYIHSLMLTENYVVLCVWGSHYAMGGAKMEETRNMVDAMDDLDPSKPNQWYVIDRKHGRGVVAKYEGDAFFCFHTVNAWEEPSRSDPSQIDIFADLSVYENLDIAKRLYFENLKSTSPGSRAYVGDQGATTRGSIQRWRLSSVTSAQSLFANKAVLDFAAPKEKSCDLPTYNPIYGTKPSRYIYGVIDRGLSTFFDGLVKYDTKTHDALIWSQHGHSGGEPIFVPNPEGTKEDDGVLLSVVLDGNARKSYLVVLDAQSLTEIGRASMEWAVGYGAHYAGGVTKVTGL
jgi:torulene dioxygenase